MLELCVFLIPLLVVWLCVETVHEPRLDFDRQNGQLFLWYNTYNHERTFVYICQIRKVQQ